MATDGKRKSGGSKLTRTETVTVRLDPKLRYLAELAARKQRRTLSSYIEWALEESLNHVVIDEDKTFGGEANQTVADMASKLWDVDEPDRFVKLAIRYPDMLTHEEQALWKLIRENGTLWKGKFDKTSGEWTWRIAEESLVFDRLRDRWELFNAVASGAAKKDTLPTWVKNEKPDPSDFEIPF